MAAIDQTKGGLTFGRFGLGLHGTVPGTVAQQVHDGDTVNVRALGNFAVRFLGIDTPEVSFTLPGTEQFVAISNAAWDGFLTDPFAPNLQPLALDGGLKANLLPRLGPGAAANHVAHAQAAHRELERQILADMQARGLSKDAVGFFAAFARELVDRYGRLLAFLNIDDRENTPTDYNTRLLEQGLATPYFIWPNVDPWRTKANLAEAALPPAQFHAHANAGKLRAARRAVAEARAAQRGIFAADDPLRVLAFELRYLAQRRRPDRWVIDLGTASGTLLKPEDYYTVAKIEDRLFVPADYLALFEKSGWRLQQ
jgi:endonuclease YncB( thermonuclease family)